MQTAYFEAVINRRHNVLGRRLHDFCLYDALFLEIAENAVWCGGREAGLADLEEAVLICSLPPERFLAADLTPRGIIAGIRRKLWLYRCVRRDLATELEFFQSYIADFYSPPQLWDAATKGRSLKAPWILSLASFIELHSNMSEREIMTAPVGLMLWKAQSIAERLGENVADLMTEDEIAMGREQQAALAEAGEDFPEEGDEIDG